MDSLEKFTELLRDKQNLEDDQIRLCINLLTAEEILLQEKEDFLLSLATKGETAEETASFINCFRELARNPELQEYSDHAIDLCGTGGDRAGSFNISTFVSFILASADVPVIKHGNRSISSKCGSADLLEAIGIPLELDIEQINESMKQLSFTFLFAPSFHPAFKHIAPVRKELARKGIITIFNVLGPLINPARPGFQVLGVYAKELVSRIGNSLKQTGIKRGSVVHGCVDNHPTITGVDELTSSGQNIVCSFGQGKGISNESWGPEKFGLEYSKVSDIKGGDLKRNLELMNLLLIDRAPKGLMSSVLMNAALAFMTIGKTNNLQEGIGLAKQLLKDGEVKKWLDRVRTFYS
jgi:anthranilate phosphoribosyltransferase